MYVCILRMQGRFHTFGVSDPHTIITQVKFTYVTMVRKLICGRKKATCTAITTPSTGESLINQFRICFVQGMQM
jgi:hypothetical protein